MQGLTATSPLGEGVVVSFLFDHMNLYISSYKNATETTTHSNIPKILVSNDTASAEPIEITNIFNNFFTSISAKTKESIKYSHKHFFNFLKNRSDDSCFFQIKEFILLHDFYKFCYTLTKLNN